jgi:phospholipid/cholesterol/gamma-HCH transport system substrate-binding protein
MNPRVSFMVTGAFVVLGGVLLVVFALAFRQPGGAASTHYSMHFRESVAGLTTGASVRFMGVPVGQVESLSLQPGDTPVVRVDASVRADVPIDEFSVASLAYEGITGVAYVNLERSDESVGSLATGTEPGLIETRPGPLNAVVASAPDIAIATGEALTRLNQLLSDHNLGALSQAIGSLREILATIETRRRDIDAALASVARASSRVDAAAGELDRLIAATAPDLRSTASSLGELSMTSARLVDRLDQLSRDNEAAIAAFLGDGLGQVPGVTQTLAETLAEIRTLAEQLSEDPSRILYQARRDRVELPP